MKKLIFTAALVVSGFYASAQVGIGTVNPQTSLHVVGNAGDTPGALVATDGITIPVVTTNMTAAVAGTKISQMVYSTHASTTGYYFWNGTAWTALGAAAAAPAMTVTVTSNPSYTVLATDTIIEYVGPTTGNWIMPTDVPVGKIFYFASTSGGQISLAAIVTGAANNISPDTGAAVIHLGGGRYASLMAY